MTTAAFCVDCGEQQRRRHGRITRHAPAIVTRLPNVRSGDWPGLRRLLSEAGVPLATPIAASHRPGREIAMLLGRTLGGLPIGLARLDASIRMEEPKAIDELEGLGDEALARHNRRVDRLISSFNLSRFTAADPQERLRQSG